ncbi:hypothetical protein TSAR_007951, partial [Trichomalopsis sarcophagae]
YCRFKTVCRAGLRVHAQVQARYSSTSVKAEWQKRRNVIFDNEKGRLRAQVGRIEKIGVKYLPTDNEDSPLELAMNRDLSTPDDCAQHISEGIHKTAALALVDGVPWDMHKPLTKDCEIKFLTMHMPKDSPALNPAFWRTCSLIMGAMIDSAFKDDIQLYLHSFPRPNLKSGSFTYDVVLDLPDWHPTAAQLRAMSAQFVKIATKNLPVERLQVSEELALDMFQDNPFKSKQIPDIAKSNEGRITLYRIGEHIDISKGPMVGNTGIVGRVTVASVHKIESEETDHMYRFQGVALPKGIMLNHFAYGILEDRAKNLNQNVWIPSKIHEEIEEKSTLAANN